METLAGWNIYFVDVCVRMCVCVHTCACLFTSFYSICVFLLLIDSPLVYTIVSNSL